jgi:hypothetical protein
MKWGKWLYELYYFFKPHDLSAVPTPPTSSPLHYPPGGPTGASPPRAPIHVILTGNPQGIYLASNHEKLLLIDPECPQHAVGFVGVKINTEKQNFIFVRV